MEAWPARDVRSWPLSPSFLNVRSSRLRQLTSVYATLLRGLFMCNVQETNATEGRDQEDDIKPAVIEVEL